MLRYTSTLESAYSEALERLMFFNPGQHAALEAIMDSVDTFGAPSVFDDAGRLRIKVEKLDEVQALYALDEDVLVGVLVFYRVSLERLTVIHIAVDHEYSSQGEFAQSMLVMRMLELLRSNARRIKGVETIRILCSGNQVRDYPV